MTDVRQIIARYGSDERRREMGDYLAFRRNVGRRPGESQPASAAKALDILDAMSLSDLTLLELEMNSNRAGHESDYDPLAR